MEDITLGQVSTVLAFLVAIIGSVEYLSLRLKKWLRVLLKDEIEPLKNDLEELKNSINNETLARCKYDLIAMMSRIQNGYAPNMEEVRILKETKEIYNNKGGDSYVDDMFEDLKKKGLI